MESLPQHLRFKELWGGTDVDIEPEQCSNLFDSPFPFGIPPVIPDAENHANEILDDIWEGSNTHCLHNSQRCFLPPPNINSLLSCDVSMVPSELKVLRNLTSGTHEGYEEVFTEEDELEDNKQVIDLTKDLLTVPPGFEEGVTFDSEQRSSEDKLSVRHVLNLADVLSSGEPEVLEEPSLEVKQISDSLLNQTLDDAGLLEHLQSEPSANVLKISNVTNNRSVCLEWAEQVDISKPMLDFHEKVPDPAFSWPFELDTFQKKAIVHLENKDSVFVAAHTSAGKTVVAEYAIALSRRHMTRTIYTSPIKALSNEKYRDFKETFTDIGLITGDVQINKEASCLIMTTEILRSMLYNQSNVVADLEWVIFDECHYINDPDRGVVWEEVLIMLPSHVGLVLLSATVPNALSLANWIGRIKEHKLYVICTTQRPVPLEHHLYFNQETFLILDATNKFQTASYMKACARRKETMKGTRTYDDKTRYQGLIQHLRKADRLPAICFTLSRRRCDENAQLLQSLDLTTAEEKGAVRCFLQNSVISRLSRADQRLPQLRSLRGLLEAGFGVHHSGVLPILKEAVEMLFQRGLVKVLFATETFAMGVNMPARTVVFDSIRKHDGISNRDLLPAEYIQMAGRAGRRGKDATGTVLILCKGDVPESSQLQAMMLGRPTELQSRFRVTYSMILNLKAQANKRVEDMMRDSFRENSSQSQSLSLAERCASLENELSSLAPIVCTTCQELPFELLEEEAAARVTAWEHILSQPQAARCLSPGHLLLVRSPEGCNLLGALASLAPREKRLTLWALADSQPRSSGKASLPWPLSKKAAVPDAALSVQEMTVMFCSVLCIYAKSIKVDPKRMSLPRCRNVLGQELLELVEAHPGGLPVINVVKELRLSAMETVELVNQSQQLEKKLLQSQCLSCPLFESHFEQEQKRRRLSEELRKLQHQLSEESLASMPDYRSHVLALEKLGYVEPSGTLTLKGRVARSLSSHEVMLTELLLQESLLTLGAAEVAGLFSCFVYEHRCKDEVVIPLSMKAAVEKFVEVARKIGHVQRESGFDEPAQQFVEQFSFGLCNVVYHWARGMHFAHIMELTEVQEGIIVRCIQRLDELLKDVKTAAGIVGNPELRTKMEEASRLIRRDIVFAASLYLQ
ncbi:superkiller complex helicase subunit twister isoform X1 [Rhipicephalus microplus]|uniref:superkiller complex helicase subunit twister isoform X1 n=1 Tax=Rhipicephalus microplus TaxID=6941 RepID=UPI003F6D8B4B